jgi:GxxExxY protein
MTTAEYKHVDLTSKIIRCVFKVHSKLGPGFPEKVYKNALCRELAIANIPFATEKRYEVLYEGVLCGEFFLDILVDEKVIVELKALDGLCDEHLSQCLSYLKATGLELVLLVNFGTSRAQVKRVVI